MNDISTDSNGVEDLALVETKPGPKTSQLEAEPGVNISLAEPEPGVEFNDSKPKTMNPSASWEPELNIETRENIIINTDQIQLEGTREWTETSTFIQNSTESETYIEDITADVTSSYDDIESMSDMPGIETVTMLPKKEDTEDETETTIIPEDETETTIIPENESETTIIPEEETETTIIPENESETTKIPEDETETTIIPEDETETTIIPEDETETTKIPEDESETTIIPEDETETTIIPEDETETTKLPEDELATTIIPEDEIETTKIPEDKTETTIIPEDKTETTIMPINEMEGRAMIKNIEDEFLMLSKNDVETSTNMPNIDYQTSTTDMIASDALNLKEITISPIDDMSTVTPLPKDEIETAGVPMELIKMLPITEKIMEVMETTLNPMDKIETTFLSIDVSQTTIMPTEEMESSSIKIIEKKEENSQIYNQEPRISLLDENPAVNKISEIFESKNLELSQGLAEETTTIAASAKINLEALETTSAAAEVDSEDLLLIEEEVSENLTTSDYLESAVAAVDIDSTTLPSILNKSGKFHKFENYSQN